MVNSRFKVYQSFVYKRFMYEQINSTYINDHQITVVSQLYKLCQAE